MKKLITGCIILWSATHCTPILKGFIFEKETLAPVIGANIQVSNTEIGVASNEFGCFTLSDLKPGSYTLNISSVGFKKVNIPVELQEMNEPLSIQLEKGAGIDAFYTDASYMDSGATITLMASL